MSRKRPLVFLRLHPFNRWIAALLSKFFSVAYWKLELVPAPGFAQWLDHWEHFTLDEWNAIQRESHQVWRIEREDPSALPPSAPSSEALRDGADQWLLRSIEERVSFQRLVERAYGTQVWIAPDAWLGCIWDRVYPVLIGLKTLRESFRGNAKRAKNGAVSPYWFRAIASSEIASSEGKLDFTFALRSGGLKSEEAFYLLPREPRAGNELDHLSKRDARWALERDLLALVPIHYRFLALAEVVYQALFNHHRCAPFLVRLRAKSAYWARVLREYRPRAVVASVSAGWPEHPEAVTVREAGSRAVLWFYSANSILPGTRMDTAPEPSPPFSLPIAQELFVWNEYFLAWLRSRTPPDRWKRLTRIEAVGPLMCGNAEILKKSARVTREALRMFAPEKRCIALFDVPSADLVKRREICLPLNHYTTAAMDRFSMDLLDFAKAHPEVRLLLKPKRARHASDRTPSIGWETLLDQAVEPGKEGTVCLLPHDSDPYLPIAACDLAVGLAFTSPVLAAVGSGRSGIFYDPESRAAGHFRSAYQEVLSQGREALFRKLEEWLLDPEAFARGNRESGIRNQWLEFNGVSPAREFVTRLKASS